MDLYFSSIPPVLLFSVHPAVQQGSIPLSVASICTVCYRKKVREMSTGDKLFVPSGGALSWRAKGGGREDDEAIAVRFCYVDASNFNSAKSQLPLYAAVEVRSALRLGKR